MHECLKFANKVCLAPLLVVKSSRSNGGSVGSITGRTAKIPHALQPNKLKTEAILDDIDVLESCSHRYLDKYKIGSVEYYTKKEGLSFLLY